MLYFNVLSAPGTKDDDMFFASLPTQHARYADEATANLHAEYLRAQGIDAYVVAWHSLA